MKRHWILSALLLTVVGLVAFRYYQMQGVERDLRDIRHLPAQVGEWTAADLPVSEHEYDILETRNLVLRDYKNQKGDVINLFLIYSETNRRVCHPPVVCLIGSGIEVEEAHKETLTIGGRTLPVNRLIARGGKSDRLVLYFYMVGQDFTEDYVTQQLRWVVKQATGKGVGGAMVRVMVPITEGEEAALAEAKGFLEKLLPLLMQERST